MAEQEKEAYPGEHKAHSIEFCMIIHTGLHM